MQSFADDDATEHDNRYREWRGLVASDYDRAILRVAIATREELRQLIFAWVELMPVEIPSPPEAFAKKNFKGIQLSASRVICGLEEGLDWYEAAWAGDTRLPRSITPVETAAFVAEPSVKRFALPGTPPFSPTWHMRPRLHRLVPADDPEGMPAELATGLTTVPAFRRARVWLEGQLHFDALAHDDWLGSVALVAPNPLMREIGLHITSRDNAAETVEVGGQLRAGQKPDTLKVVFQERRVEAVGVYAVRSLDLHGLAQERFEPEVADFGMSLICNERGILHEAMPSWFIRGVDTRVEDPPASKQIAVPSRKARGKATVLTTSVFSPKASRPGPLVTGLRRLTELGARQRRRFGEMRPLMIGPEQRDTLIFHFDRGLAVEQIRRLIGRARRRLIFVDHYFGAQEVMEFATAVTEQRLAITILTGRDTGTLTTCPLGAPRGLTAAAWLEQAAADLAADDLIKPTAVNLKIPAGGRGFHDRFLIIDDDAWHCGHSFNKVGDGEFSAMTRITRPNETIALIVAEIAKAEPFSQWKAKALAGETS